MLAGNWTLKAEYLYLAFSSESFAVPLTNGPAFRQTMFVDADFSAHVARVGFNTSSATLPRPRSTSEPSSLAAHRRAPLFEFDQIGAAQR
jgi:hypothetical protein